MSWHPTRTPGSALRRFRLWVIGWSGGTALLRAALAIWRTVTLDSAQFAVLLSETTVGPAAGQFAKINNLFYGMRRYKTLGLVWFDIARAMASSTRTGASRTARRPRRPSGSAPQR